MLLYDMEIALKVNNPSVKNKYRPYLCVEKLKTKYNIVLYLHRHWQTRAMGKPTGNWRPRNNDYQEG